MLGSAVILIKPEVLRHARFACAWRLDYNLQVTELKFDGGTLVLEGDLPEQLPPQFEWDERVERHRAPAIARRAVVGWLQKREVQVDDRSSNARSLNLKLRAAYEPRPYQKEALEAWKKAGGCGTVVLPTGAGKTFVAVHAIAHIGRSALVVAPTIDLMSQWYSLLVDSFGVEVGILGGGCHEIRDITVTTYDSAYIHAGDYGSRTGYRIDGHDHDWF